LLGLLGFRPPERRTLDLDTTLIEYVYLLAEREGCPPNALAAELLTSGLVQHSQSSENLEHWHTLTPRQQQVAAMACLGYSNGQIAARLVISVETVKAHMRGALQKFSVHSRGELCALLGDWDFSAWDR
jgi:DNA-binding NarL/FixJ family response regulator